jgi:putative phosphoribosyl transferase
MVTAECPARAYLTPTRGRTSPIRTGRRRLWRPLVTAAFVIGQQSAILFQALNQQLKGVGAIVSRGGRPNLAGAALVHVRTPTLLIVGGNDLQVIELNRQAFAQLPAEKELAIVRGATHLFVEPGTLDEVARLAQDSSDI